MTPIVLNEALEVRNPMGEMGERDAVHNTWRGRLTRAAEVDSWGQVVEAEEAYQALARAISAAYDQSLNDPGLQTVLHSQKEREIAHRIVLCLSARVEAIQTLSERISAADMKLLLPALDECFLVKKEGITKTLTNGPLNKPFQFPIAAHKFGDVAPLVPLTQNEKTSALGDTHAALGRVQGTVVTIRVDRIGLKDAETYIEPVLNVLVADAFGRVLDEQEIGEKVGERSGTNVEFGGHTVYHVN